MKKILSLFALLMTIVIGAKAADVKVTYALAKDDAFTSGQTVTVNNSNSEKVATITYGESGGSAFKAAKSNSSVTGFTAFTEGNGTNGNQTGGTFYTIVPDYDGTIEIAVVINADKTFIVEENGTALPGYDKESEKLYGTKTFDVKAGKSYKCYVSGSKMGFYGFNYTYSASTGPEDPVFTLSKSALEVGETAKILVDGKDIFAANFTAGTLWQSEADCISLSAEGVVTALKNTPANYYFHFFGTSKDATKYNSVTSDNLNLTIATKYSVTYDLADATAGTVPTEEDQIEGAQFTVAAIPTDLVAPAGQEFKCWNDGTNDYNPGATYTVGTSDVTLTAVYQDKTYQGLTPTATLNFANPGTTFASEWYTTEGKLVKDFDYDPANGKVAMSAYAVYQSVNAQKIAWEAYNSGNSSEETWDATGDFKGSSYYFESEPRAAVVQVAARIHYYRVAGITGVSAFFNGKAAIEAYEVNGGVVTADPVASSVISAAGTASLTTLDATKEYIIAARGNNGTSNVRFYEIAFTFPAITTENITIGNSGVATYVTKNALDFSTQNGAFTAYTVTDIKTKSVATAEVTQVPAGTPLLLKGAAGSYDVEVIESAQPVDNLLKAADGIVAGDGSTIFAYSNKTFKFAKVAEGLVIPEGKAYLQITTPNAPTALDVDFDGATAVETIAEANEADSAAPVKVVKNGKLYIGNYNVAGQLVK